MVTLSAESLTLPSLRMTKKLPRLTELMAGHLSSEFTDFNIPSGIQLSTPP